MPPTSFVRVRLPARRAERAESVDGAGVRELRGAEPRHEVPATYVPGLLHRLEDRIDADEATGEALGEDRLAGDDAVAIQELAGERVGALGGGRRRLPEPGDERPPAGAGRGTRAPERARPRPTAGPLGPDLRRGAPHEGAQGRERVVRDLARPDEIPEGGEQYPLVRGAGGRDEVRPEGGPSLREMRADGGVQLTVRRLGGGREQRRRIGSEHERDATVVGPERSGADPGHVAARHERVEFGGTVAAHPARQDVGLEDRRGHRRALEPRDRVGERVDISPGTVRPLPRGEESAERGGVDRLDLAPEQGERTPTEAAEHVGVAPLPAGAARTELAANDRVGGFERSERLLHALGGRAEPSRDLRRR